MGESWWRRQLIVGWWIVGCLHVVAVPREKHMPLRANVGDQAAVCLLWSFLVFLFVLAARWSALPLRTTGA